MERKNEFGFDEVVDTSCDAIEATDMLVEATKDGVGLNDAGALFSVSAKVGEIVKDSKVFIKQLRDLTPDESTEANYQIAKRLGRIGENTNFVEKAISAFSLLSRWHRLGDDLFTLVQDTISFVKPKDPVLEA